MGDVIEFSSWPKHPLNFYRVTSGAIAFEVQCDSGAGIKLYQKLSKPSIYQIGFGAGSRVWIHQNDNILGQTSAPSLLSRHEYHKYWLTWYGDSIKLGRDGETKPLLKCAKGDYHLNYITFSVIEGLDPVHWKLELPPFMKEPPKVQLKEGKPTWVAADDQLPDGALLGGYQVESLYIIRAAHRGSLTPGKFVPSEGTGYIAWGGASHDKNELEVLCGYNCIWIKTIGSKIPVGAVQGGHSENNEILYVGRAEHEGHLIPGKVQPSHKVCYIPHDGKEIAKKSYEILVEPDTNVRCVNQYYIYDADCSEEDNDEGESWGPADDYDDGDYDYDNDGGWRNWQIDEHDVL